MTRDGPFWTAALAVASGAAIGALLRWGLAYWLNPRSGWLPLGTFAANTLGGFLCGLALGWTAATPALSPAVRLFVITGFLGGLTTFSTFSGEAFSLISSGEILRGAAHVFLHTAASLTATWLGFLLWKHFF